MTSVPMSVFPLSAVLPGQLPAMPRKYGSAPPVAALEILAGALVAEDRALTAEPSPSTGRRVEVSGFGDRPLDSAQVEARPRVLPGRSTVSPAMAIIHAHRQRRTGLEETIFALFYGNLSLFRTEETARALWGEGLNGAVISTCAAEVTGRIDAWLK